ncbi:MAG: chorismate mutase [Candidatus Marinimicrobia bacterium]|nr:chorismate mutase [Candidatus Neomarinimicrobiota bacterium]
MDSHEKINTLRKIIDDYDDQILDLLIKRFSVSTEIGVIKTANGLEIGDPNREQEIINRLSKKLKGKLNKDDIAAIFSQVYQISKKIQIKES